MADRRNKKKKRQPSDRKHSLNDAAAFASIVIPVHNRVELTRLCLEAIEASTPPDAYELIIVDNGSTDGTTEYLRSKKAKVIRFEENKGIAVAWNAGIREAKGRFIVFLHNDVLVTPGWLGALLEPLLKDKKIACSSPSYTEFNLQPGFERLAADVAGLAPTWWEKEMQPFCFALSRNAIHRVGEFDEALTGGPYSDLDYEFRILEAGLKVVGVNNALVHHFVYQTVINIPEFCWENDKANWEYMRKKWHLPLSEAKSDDPSYGNVLEAARRVSIPISIPTFLSDHRRYERKPVKIIACISFFNDVQQLPGCIDSLDGVDEVILVDGAYADYPHDVPWSTDGSLEWLLDRREIDPRIRLIECERAWVDEIEKRSAYFAGEDGDWYLIIDADERLVSADSDPIGGLREYLASYPFDALLLDVETRPSTVSLERYARVYRHLPGLRYKLTHYNVVANDRRPFIESMRRGTASLYRGLHILHLKQDRGDLRLGSSAEYYRRLPVKELEAIKKEIVATWNDPERQQDRAFLIALYEVELAHLDEDMARELALDPRYLSSQIVEDKLTLRDAFSLMESQVPLVPDEHDE